MEELLLFLLKFTTLYVVCYMLLYEHDRSRRPASRLRTLLGLFSSPSQPLVRGRIPYGLTTNLTEFFHKVSSI